MPAHTLTRRLFWAAEIVVLTGTIAAAAWLSSAEEWQPLALVSLLLVLTLVGDWLSIETPGGELSCALVAIVLVMALLGPAPAMAFSVAGTILNSATRRVPVAQFLNNVATFAVVPFAGGWSMRELALHFHVLHN